MHQTNSSNVRQLQVSTTLAFIKAQNTVKPFIQLESSNYAVAEVETTQSPFTKAPCCEDNDALGK